MSPEALLIWLFIGSAAGLLGRKFIGGRPIGWVEWVALYVLAAGIGGWLLPRLGLHVAEGIIADIVNACLGVLLLALPITLMFRPRTAKQTQAVPGEEYIGPKFNPLGRFGSRTQPGNRIFITYRRNDSLDVTGRLYDRLIKEFGEKSVFRDLDSVPIGFDFRQHIDQ